MKIFGIVVLCIIGFTLLFATCGVVNFSCGALNNAAQVAKKELYPDALLKKYEWFKNASASLDKKVADISVYDEKLADLKKDKKTWDRTDKETYRIWAEELAGIKSSYNDLSAEYNAQMSKLNWKFCNVGELPPGAIQPLPREYKPYIGK